MSNINKYEDLAKRMNALDEGLKKLLFGVSEIEVDDIDSLDEALIPMTKAAYLLIYLKWNKHGKEVKIMDESEHAKRAFDILKKMYDREPYGLDSMIYVLTEAYRDVMQNGKRSFFYGIMVETAENEKCSYSLIYDLISSFWSNDASLSGANSKVVLDALLSLFNNLNELEGVKFVDNGEKRKFTIGSEEYDASDYLIRDSYKIYYMLRTREQVSDKSMLCKYVGFNKSKKQLEQLIPIAERGTK